VALSANLAKCPAEDNEHPAQFSAGAWAKKPSAGVGVTNAIFLLATLSEHEVEGAVRAVVRQWTLELLQATRQATPRARCSRARAARTVLGTAKRSRCSMTMVLTVGLSRGLSSFRSSSCKTGDWRLWSHAP
jgi:hypothetical protein